MVGWKAESLEASWVARRGVMKVAQTVECLVASMADQLVEKREEHWLVLSASPKVVQSAAALVVMMVNRMVAWRADVTAGLSER